MLNLVRKQYTSAVFIALSFILVFNLTPPSVEGCGGGGGSGSGGVLCTVTPISTGSAPSLSTARCPLYPETG